MNAQRRTGGIGVPVAKRSATKRRLNRTRRWSARAHDRGGDAGSRVQPQWQASPGLDLAALSVRPCADAVGLVSYDAPMSWSIRTFSIAWAVAYGILALAVTSTLVWSSSRMRAATDEVHRGTMGARLANDLERSLIAYQRMSNLALLFDDASIEASRAELLDDIGETQRAATGYVSSASEQEALDEARAAIDAFLRERERAEARGLAYAQLIAQTRGSFDRALAAADTLRRINEDQIAEAVQSSGSLDEASNIVGIGAALLLAAGLVGLLFAARRQVLRPLWELDRAVRSYRGGSAHLTVRPRGARELRSLGAALGEMSAALARQREQQIAFVAGVVHDVRNPLAGMKTALQLAREDPEPQILAQVLPLLDRQVDRLSRMLGDLLDATRIESGQLELCVERFDLSRAAREVARLYEGTSPLHPIRLTTGEEPVVVEGDPLRVEQVLGNLVSNAIKYSPDGGAVEIRIRSERRTAIVEVRDHGIGIPADRVASVFLPFQRVASDVASGAGLGLSVASRIVRAHGGEIEVESTPGAGSTFRVRLPLVARAGRSAMQTDATAP